MSPSDHVSIGLVEEWVVRRCQPPLSSAQLSSLQYCADIQDVMAST